MRTNITYNAYSTTRSRYYIKAPGVVAHPGSTSELAVSGIDFYATILEIVGVAVPAEQQVDGVSLVPVLRGGALPTASGRARLLFAHEPHYGNQGGEPASHVLRGDMKLILYHEDMHEELYDIRADVGEGHDLAGVASHATTVRELRAELDRWLATTHARMPEPDAQFDRSARQARWAELMTSGMSRLESQHAGFLAEDFEPNADWWGSSSQAHTIVPPKARL